MAPRTAHPEPPAIQLHPTHRQRTPQYAYVAEILRAAPIWGTLNARHEFALRKT